MTRNYAKIVNVASHEEAQSICQNMMQQMEDAGPAGLQCGRQPHLYNPFSILCAPGAGDKLVAMAQEAAQLGVELFVRDDDFLRLSRLYDGGPCVGGAQPPDCLGDPDGHPRRGGHGGHLRL